VTWAGDFRYSKRDQWRIGKTMRRNATCMGGGERNSDCQKRAAGRWITKKSLVGGRSKINNLWSSGNGDATQGTHITGGGRCPCTVSEGQR